MRTFILFVLLLATATACKKGKPIPESERIIGKWNLVLLTGGIAGIHQTATQWGHTKSITFRTDNNSTSTFDTASTSNTYSVIEEYSGDYNRTLTFLYMDANKFVINYAHDTLIIDSYNIIDGIAEWYVRE